MRRNSFVNGRSASMRAGDPEKHREKWPENRAPSQSQIAARIARAIFGPQVRRLTPKECARLQGFPDDYLSQVPGVSDSAQYRALGNSMAVPVMRWLGERIDLARSA